MEQKDMLVAIESALKEAKSNWDESRKKELEGYEMDEEQRRREIGFLEYEIQEISQAQLCSGEDEELETSYRKLANGKRITEGLGYVYQLTGYEGEGMGAYART